MTNIFTNGKTIDIEVVKFGDNFAIRADLDLRKKSQVAILEITDSLSMVVIVYWIMWSGIEIFKRPS